MKSKIIVITSVILIILVGAYYYFKSPQNKLTTHQKLLENGYEVINKNEYIKNFNDTDYYYLNLESDIKYFIVANGEKYKIYFFQNESTSIGGCEYDVKNKKVIDDSLCVDDYIEKATKLKQTFEEQLNIMNITIDDLEQINEKLS